MKKLLLLPVMMIALAVSPVTFAKYKTCPCQDVKKMEKELNLTAEQKKKIKEIRKEAKDKMKAKWAEKKAIYKQKQELVRAEKLDEGKVDELVNQKKEIMASIMKTKITMQHDIYHVLDEGQKQKLSKMMDEWHQKKMEKKNKKHDDENHGMDDDD